MEWRSENSRTSSVNADFKRFLNTELHWAYQISELGERPERFWKAVIPESVVSKEQLGEIEHLQKKKSLQKSQF
jgi:hypothetical protein